MTSAVGRLLAIVNLFIVVGKQGFLELDKETQLAFILSLRKG